jgi:hypothetical protein
MCLTISSLDVDHHFLEEGTQEFFAIAVRRCGSRPKLLKISAEGLNALQLVGSDWIGPLEFSATKLRFGIGEVAETSFPFGFQATCDESIFGFDRAVAAFGTFSFVAYALDIQAPLLKRSIVVGLELARGQYYSFDGGRGHGLEKGVGYSLVDSESSDVEAVHATSFDDIFTGTVITWGRVAAAIMSTQFAAAMAAGGEALQEGGAFSHGTSGLMRFGASVGIESSLIGLKGWPIDESGMMIGNEDEPLSEGEVAHSFFDDTVFVDITLAATFTIGVGASIYRISQDTVDGGVGGGDPTDLAMGSDLHRTLQRFGTEPEPDASCGAVLCESIKDGAEGAGDGGVGMEEDLAIGFAPDKADGQAATQFAASCLVADASIESSADDVQFGFTHGALETEQEAIVEESGMVDTVAVSNEGVGEAAEFEQAIPVSVVASKAGNLDAKDDAHSSQGDLTGHANEARPFVGGGTGQSEILIDDDDLLLSPSQLAGSVGEGVLASSGLAVVLDL